MITTHNLLNQKLSNGEKKQISATIRRLGQAKMTESAHGYDKTVSETIRKASERSTTDYTKTSRKSSAIGIMTVLLAANRNYNRQVSDHVKRLKENYCGLTIKDLAAEIRNAKSFEGFSKVWGHRDEKKFRTLEELVLRIMPTLGTENSARNDYKVMSKWASQAMLSAHKNDPLGSVRNIGIATFQHLRMTFGVDTVKPDLRVMDVLEREFGLVLRGHKAILAVERIAELENVSALLIDQIFVKYGSGYYLESRRKSLVDRNKGCVDAANEV